MNNVEIEKSKPNKINQKSPKPGIEQKHSNPAVNDIINWKKTADLALKTKAREVENIFKSQKENPPLEAAEQLFLNVVHQNQQMRKKLTSREVIETLNDSLIAKKVQPKLDEASREGKITNKEKEEYIKLLKLNMSGKLGGDDIDALTEKEHITRREQITRWIELDNKTDNASEDVSSHMGGIDLSYSLIFDALLRQATMEEIERLTASFGKQLNQEKQEKLKTKAEEIIDHPPKWELQDYKAPLDLNKQDIKYFRYLAGLERWPIVREFCKTLGVIPKEVFDRSEKIIMEKFLDVANYEHKFGMKEEVVTEPRRFVADMARLDNPDALPLMLRYIEENTAPLFQFDAADDIPKQMKRLLKESNTVELQKTMESMPKNKRLVLEIFADENSYLQRLSKDYGIVDPIWVGLQNGDLTIAKEQLIKLLDQTGNYKEETLKNIYKAGAIDYPEVIDELFKIRPQVEKTIINGKLGIWPRTADKLMAALVNPKHGEAAAFPKRIAKEGLGISDEKMLGILDQVLTSKTLKESNLEREEFVDGLILLNSKENGKAVLETLFSAYQGTKKDPSRMRRIFQFLSTLDSFGEYEFVTPDKNKINSINWEITDLQNQLPNIKDKMEKKKIRSGIDTRNKELQDLTGLKGIEDVMRQKVVEAACRRLELPQEYQAKIENKLEEFMRGGLFDIIPTLAGTYERKNEPQVKNLLKAMTVHIVDGDFQKWRYSHEKSDVQLSGLSPEEKDFWKKNIEPVTVHMAQSKEENIRRADELTAAQAIINNAKEHILESHPDFEFSQNQVNALHAQINELTEKLKSASTEDVKKSLAAEKRTLQAKAILIERIVNIENLVPEDYKKENIINQAKEIGQKISELRIPLAGLDIEQIGKIFTVGDIENVTAYESDDPLTLLKVGVEPIETCQSWRNGGHNECLPAYVGDSNKRVLNVSDSKGNILDRSIIKVTHQKDNDDPELKNKTILAEKPYATLPSKEVNRAFIRLLLKKAQGINSAITISKGASKGAGFDDAAIKVFKEEAEALGYKMSEKQLDVYIPPSMNQYEYSDALGGKINWFDRYERIEAITFEKNQ